MGRLDRPDLGDRIALRLSASDCSLLLGLPVVGPKVQDVLSQAQVGGDGEGVLWLDERGQLAGCLAGCAAFEADRTEDAEVRERLRRLFHRLADLVVLARTEELSRFPTIR